MEENLGQGMWCGKKLDDMTREELYEAFWSLDQLRKSDWKQHEKDIELFRPLNK